jgi:hypothetical protein
MEYSAPVVAVTMKMSEKYVKAVDHPASHVGHHRLTFKCLRQKMAGNKSVSGTDVSAPIKDTKSLKKGMALATVYAVTAMNPVSIIQRSAGSAVVVKPGN